MRAQDRDTVKLCRTVLAAIANAEAVPVEHGPARERSKPRPSASALPRWTGAPSMT